MAGVVAMLAGGLGGKSTESGGATPEVARRQSSYKKKQEEMQKKGGKIKSARVETIQLNRDLTEPCDVYSWFEITVTDINVPAQTFSTSIEIHLFWQDYSLPGVFPDYDEEDFKIDNDNLPVKMTEIFENQLSCRVVVDPMFNYYKETSTIYMMFIVECTFVERMELQRFPIDRQFLSMEFNGYHGQTKTGNWNWILKKNLEWVPEEFRNKDYCVRMVSSISSEYDLLPIWINYSMANSDNSGNNSPRAPSQPQTLNNNNKDKSKSKSKNKDNKDKQTILKNEVASDTEIELNESDNMSGAQSGLSESDLLKASLEGQEIEPLLILMRVNRRPHFYYGNIIFPNFLIGLGCGAAFIVPPDSLADRLGVLITLMLAAVAFRFVVSTMLPRVTYLTLMDKYLLLSFVMIIVLIGENTIVAIEGLFSTEWVLGFDYTFAMGFYIGWGSIHLFFVLSMIWPSFYRIGWQEMYVLDMSDDDEPVTANEYQFIKTNTESQPCIDKWKQQQEAAGTKKD